MGISIDLYRYDFKEFKEDLMKTFPQIKDEELLSKIMLQFGTLIGNDLIVLHNEYYEDGICTWNMFHIIEKVFEIDTKYPNPDVQDVSFKHRHVMLGYKEKYDAYSELGIEPPEEE